MAFRGLVAMCNLLLGEFNVLKNRYLHVDWKYKTFGNEKIFGRGDVVSVLPITARPATDLIKKMQALGSLESVHGLGKGKYRFVVKDAD